ncbi:hypothetical protein [Curtobacterium flaccumfaciens]|uniref:hypothetical protein n=1 Tax=Curtobacterium flaccumfaciens TaxID=2035 RepID=UPI001126713D|nr:hypothetical protein [Curtobacterium flaccumfaciens]TPG05171.1 hypothetical protein EAH85_14480 [Curtobacterium flaccumfaciens]
MEAYATEAYGFPPPLWILSLGCAILFAATVGYAIGALLPQRWYVGPAVGILFYAGYAILIVADVPYGVLSLYPASGNYITVFVRTVTRTLAAEAIFFTAAASLILFLTAWQRRRLGRSLLGVVLASALTIGAGVVIVGANGQVVTGHNSRDFICSGVSPTLCLNRGYAPASHALQREFNTFNRRAVGTPLAAKRLEQNVEGYGDRPSSGARSVYLEQWAANDDLTFSVFRYVQKYGGSSRCTSSDAAFMESEVNSWLSGYYESTAGADADFVTQSLSKLSVEDGNRWFRAHYDAYAACTLSKADLP